MEAGVNATKTIARRAGALYFVFMLLGIYSEFLFPRFMVPGDAAATAGTTHWDHKAGFVAGMSKEFQLWR